MSKENAIIFEASGMMVGKYMTKNHLINQSNQEKPSPP